MTLPLPDPAPDTANAVSAPPADPSNPPGDLSEGLFGISFAGLPRAQEYLLALAGLAEAGHLILRDAVIVVKGADGNVRVAETIDPQQGRAALSGAVWVGLLGLLFGGPVGWLAGLGLGAGVGALTAKLVDLGIPDEWVGWFKQAVRPGTATIVALATHVDLGALSTELERFAGAKLVHTTLTPAAEALLTSALVPHRTGL